eukprot:902634_1
MAVYVQFKPKFDFVLIKEFTMANQRSDDTRKTQIDYLLNVLKVHDRRIKNPRDFYAKIGIVLNETDISLIEMSNIAEQQSEFHSKTVSHRLINELDYLKLISLFDKRFQHTCIHQICLCAR